MRPRFLRFAALVIAAAAAHAGAWAQDKCASRGDLDPAYCDENRDLVADAHAASRPPRTTRNSVFVKRVPSLRVPTYVTKPSSPCMNTRVNAKAAIVSLFGQQRSK